MHNSSLYFFILINWDLEILNDRPRLHCLKLQNWNSNSQYPTPVVMIQPQLLGKFLQQMMDWR